MKDKKERNENRQININEAEKKQELYNVDKNGRIFLFRMLSDSLIAYLIRNLLIDEITVLHFVALLFQANCHVKCDINNSNIFRCWLYY